MGYDSNPIALLKSARREKNGKHLPAGKEQLETLPEIGPVKAPAIIDGRPYKKAEDVMKVKGIKEGTFNKIKDFVVIQ